MDMGSNRQIKVLILEDDLVSKKLLQKILSHSEGMKYEIDDAGTLQDALRLTKKTHYDVLLLDLNLPDSSGTNTLRKMREKNTSSAIIVITGEYDEEYGLTTIRLGAQDCLLKGKYDVYTLKKTILYSLEHKKREEEKDVLQRELQQAQKLESIGSLAAGIAHEINTPIQFITNNVGFMAKATEKLFALIDKYKEFLLSSEENESVAALGEKARSLEKESKIAYFKKRDTRGNKTITRRSCACYKDCECHERLFAHRI